MPNLTSVFYAAKFGGITYREVFFDELDCSLHQLGGSPGE